MEVPFPPKKPIVVAEIGCNHMGNFDIAKELIELAKNSGADVAKFQKRHSKELLTEEQYNAPHPNPHNSYGDTYGAHREALELDAEQHKQLKEHCEKLGIEYSTSVWDITSAREMIDIGARFLKVPSACNNHLEMLEVLRDEYDGEVHISTGMTTTEEEEDFIRFFEEKNAAKDRLVVYSCTSGYPVPFEDVGLPEISRLRQSYGHRVKEIAFSGHHLGVAIDLVAYALGARWIERHFTKDRTWKGTDHAASLEPGGMSKLTRDLKAAHAALQPKEEEILDIERVQRDKLKFRKR